MLDRYDPRSDDVRERGDSWDRSSAVAVVQATETDKNVRVTCSPRISTFLVDGIAAGSRP